MAKPVGTLQDTVTISRYWHAPEIRTIVAVEGISLTVTLEDFLKALAQEHGPTIAVTRAGLAAKLLKSAEAVCTRIKEESVKVV